MDDLPYAILGTCRGHGYVDADGRGIFIPTDRLCEVLMKPPEEALPVGCTATFIGMQVHGGRRYRQSVYVAVTRHSCATPDGPVMVFFERRQVEPRRMPWQRWP